jgi:hypothetical protein
MMFVIEFADYLTTLLMNRLWKITSVRQVDTPGKRRVYGDNAFGK